VSGWTRPEAAVYATSNSPPNDRVSSERLKELESALIDEINLEEHLISVFASFGNIQTVIAFRFPPITAH